MLKLIKGRGLTLFFISSSLLLLLALRYQIKPNVQLIYQYLESLSINYYGSLLDGSKISLISNSLGKNTSALPALIISVFSRLFRSNPALPLFVISGAIALSGAIFLILSIRGSEKTSKLILFILLIILSPAFVEVIKTSLEPSLVLLFFGLYRYFNKVIGKYLCLLLLLLSSYSTIFFVLALLLVKKAKNKKYRVLDFLLTVLIGVFLVFNFSDIISNYFSILSSSSHSFYIGIHKQADKVSGFYLLGKIFYNKYLVIIKSVFDRMFYFLDWDYWVFSNVSGKYVASLGLPVFSYVSIFELPFIVVGAFISFKKYAKEFIYFLVVIFSLAVSDSYFVFIPLFLAYLVYFFSLGLKVLETKKLRPVSGVVGFILIFLVIISRISMIDVWAYEDGVSNSRYYLYQEISDYLKSNKSGVVVTDRMGLPDVYLTYFNNDYLPLLRDSLGKTQVRDASGYKKSTNFANITFSSLDSESLNNITNNVVSESTFIELEEYLPDITNAESTYLSSDYHYIAGERQVSTRVKIVKFKL